MSDAPEADAPSKGTGFPLFREMLASVVVFLVALPLCMGVAVASGAPAALGLVTGIVGGLVIGALAGSPMQVSGPAAGLAVLVLGIIQDYGLNALGIAVLIAGGLQLLAGAFRLGRWFRAVSPAVIQGMLAGIGVLIFGSQFHVMFDDTPHGGGLADLMSIPQAISHLFPESAGNHYLAAWVGFATIGILAGWEKLKPKRLRAVPGALLGVVFAATIAAVMQLPIQFVDAPENLLSGLNVPTGESWKILWNPAFWGASLALGLVASAEALLCATAVDQIHTGPRTKYDKELIAQGLGNILCGAVGALPATGVIVRSKANVEAGATTRWSAVFHGGLILLFVVALPWVLRLVPLTALAAILVYIGYKLFNPLGLAARWRKDRAEFAVYMITVVAIITTNLLTGIGIGFGCALLKLIYTFTHLAIDVETTDERVDINLVGAATFVRLPQFAQAFEELPEGKEVHVHFGGLAYIDHACMEQLRQWQERYEAGPGNVLVEWDVLERHGGSRIVLDGSPPPAAAAAAAAPSVV